MTRPRQLISALGISGIWLAALVCSAAMMAAAIGFDPTPPLERSGEATEVLVIDVRLGAPEKKPGLRPSPPSPDAEIEAPPETAGETLRVDLDR